MNVVVDILREARRKIESPRCWCQGGLARDARGVVVAPESMEAIQWCAIGAILAVRCGIGTSLWVTGDTANGRARRAVYRAAALHRLSPADVDLELLAATAKDRLDALPDPPGIRDARFVNDEGTHADVLRVFDMAIAMEKQKPLWETP